MKRIFALIVAACLMLGMAVFVIGCSGCSEHSGNGTDAINNADSLALNDTINVIMEKDMENPVVVMKTNLGTMRIRLYGATPKHRDNFLKLVDEGFYKGIRFHRVINGFMIQGGDPFSRDNIARDKWGTGGPGYTIPAEFVDSLHHKKGAVAAARLGDMANPRRASSGSQFYIVQSEEGCAHLDGQYTVFGQVIEGLDVIDKIAELVVDEYDRPIASATIESVTRE